MVFAVRILSLFIVFFFNTCLLGHQYAPLDVMTDFHKVYCLERLSNLYPDYAKDKRFSEDTKTREEFLKKNPKATIIKLDDNTKRFGLLAWFSEKQKALQNDKDSETLRNFKEKWIKNAQKHKLPEDLETSSDIFLHFYKQNSDPWFLEVKHESEKYIHDIMFNHLKTDRKKFEKISDQAFRPTFDQEWQLCESLWNTFSKNLQMIYKSGKKTDFRFFENQEEKSSFLAFNGTTHLINDFTAHGIRAKGILKKELKENRDFSETNLFLFRATKPFDLKNRSDKTRSYQILDAIFNDSAPDLVWNPKLKRYDHITLSKYVSFSYGKSILSNILVDIGATPLAYWRFNASPPEARMQRLKIPFEKARGFIKNRFLFVPPQFGVLDLFLGGEFHDRSCLSEDCFDKATNDPIADKISTESLSFLVKGIDKHKKTYLILKSYTRPKTFERDFFKDVWLPHVKILDDLFYPEEENKETEMFTSNAQKALVDGIVIPHNIND